jgi:CheY-like chemotaxis protein
MGNSILLVDDDPSARRTLAQLLQQFGFHIVEAEDGPEALNTLKAVPIDLVLSDYNMPGMNGGELLRQLRVTRPDLAHVPFIIFSGYIDRWTGGPQEPAPDVVLPKPLTVERLLGAINGALKRRRTAAPAPAPGPARPL